MRFCCGVTLYNPTKEELKSIRKYKEIFDYVFLFDNTENDDRFKNRQYFSNDDGFVYISNNKNEGLSVAFNIMCREAISHRFDYICLFDQDSSILNENLSKMIDYINIDNTKNVGIYVPEVVYLHKGNSVHDNKEDKATGIEIEWAISSGSFINLLVYQKTKGFDENYFIDRLDYDYCFTIRRLGYKVINIKNVFLHQTLGEQGKVIFKKVSEHSPLRHYYIFRNRLYFYIVKNSTNKIPHMKLIGISIRHFLTILLFEKGKTEKIRMLYKGLVDYKEERMGKFSQ